MSRQWSNNYLISKKISNFRALQAHKVPFKGRNFKFCFTSLCLGSICYGEKKHENLFKDRILKYRGKNASMYKCIIGRTIIEQNFTNTFFYFWKKMKTWSIGEWHLNKRNNWNLFQLISSLIKVFRHLSLIWKNSLYFFSANLFLSIIFWSLYRCLLIYLYLSVCISLHFFTYINKCTHLEIYMRACYIYKLFQESQKK